MSGCHVPEYKDSNVLDRWLKYFDERFHERIITLENYMKNDKRPYKCPVCDGFGYRYGEGKKYRLECMSCDNKGIVWG